jgi:hypothetical protein
MEDERVAAVGVDEPIFRSAAETDHPGTGQPLPKILRQRSPQVGTPSFDALDTSALEDSLKASDGGLDFG